MKQLTVKRALFIAEICEIDEMIRKIEKLPNEYKIMEITDKGNPRAEIEIKEILPKVTK